MIIEYIRLRGEACIFVKPKSFELCAIILGCGHISSPYGGWVGGGEVRPGVLVEGETIRPLTPKCILRPIRCRSSLEETTFLNPLQSGVLPGGAVLRRKTSLVPVRNWSIPEVNCACLGGHSSSMVRFDAGEILVCSIYLIEHISRGFYLRRVPKILPTLESPCYFLNRADDLSLSLSHCI